MLQPPEIVLPERHGFVVKGSREERIQVQRKADQEYQRSPLQHFKICTRIDLFIFGERERHRTTHAEYEERINEVGRSASRPGGMPQRREYVGPGSGIVDYAHEGYSDTSKDIQ